MRAVVVVLGDVGRSPRMLAHVGSLLQAGHEVHLVGGGPGELSTGLQNAPRLQLHLIDGGAAGRGGGLGAAIATALRGVRLAWRLGWTILRSIPKPDLLLVQTPPPLPTLPVAIVAARLRGAKLIVDWHNLGWTLLALRFATRHPLVWLTRQAEFFFGRRAAGHVAVSQVLAGRLAASGMGDVAVLHDGPSSARPFPTARTDLPVEPLVIAAPMGWTRDDDLSLLSEALRLLTLRRDSAADHRGTLRLVVSGSGPLRAGWSAKLRALKRDWLQVETPDLPAEDYPAFLASAHVGLSIHRSSSGMDLPMKIVEFQSVGVPVLALEDGAPLYEIAPPGCGTLSYRSAEELAALLHTMLGEGVSENGLLARLTSEARSSRPPGDTWDGDWRRVMGPLL